MNDVKQFCTFVVESMLFGIEVHLVQEVIRFHEMTRVPLAVKEVGGLINLRGQIVTAIDMRQRLGQPPLPADGRPMNMVIRTEDGAVSLLVDEIGDVVHVEPASFEPVPETLRGAVRPLVKGVYKLEGRLLLVLDAEKAAAVVSAGDRTETSLRIAA